MKYIIIKLNFVFDYWVWLGIMFVFMLEEWVDFSSLKEIFNLIDGCLVFYIKVLEKEIYLEV